MRTLQEETVPIKLPQAEMRMTMVMMTRVHPMVVMMTQMMIQSQPLSVFNRLPTEGYTQGGKFWVRGRRDQELEGARNTRL
jgi:hypothetical protein